MSQKREVLEECERIPITDDSGIKLISMEEEQGFGKSSKSADHEIKTYGSTTISNSQPQSVGLGSDRPNGQVESQKISRFGLKQRRGDRAVTKDGMCNYKPKNAHRQNLKFYFTDFFTTLMEIKWRYTLFLFVVVYFLTWVLFALTWYLILYLNGDLNHYGESGWTPCVSNIHNFATAFLFSVETQTTIGYGFYELGDKCPEAILLFCFQSIVGVILEGLLVGILFVKMIRAKRRTATIIFSQNAVICHRDGQLYFMFRVADLRNAQHLLEAHVRAQIIRKRVTTEGELITYSQEEIEVGGDGEKDDRILLWWPTTIIHKIDEKSPLYSIGQYDFIKGSKEMFEIIVVLEGIVESTGLTMQSRSSYLPSEIFLGHRFKPLTTTKSKGIVDFSLFHQTMPEIYEP